MPVLILWALIRNFQNFSSPLFSISFSTTTKRGNYLPELFLWGGLFPVHPQRILIWGPMKEDVHIWSLRQTLPLTPRFSYPCDFSSFYSWFLRVYFFFAFYSFIFLKILSRSFSCVTWFHKNLNYCILSFFLCSFNLLGKLQFNIEISYFFKKHLLSDHFADTQVS